jgi:hypothetical protein
LPRGPGSYGNICHKIHSEQHARSTILIIIEGDKGDGFDVEGELSEIHELPKFFRKIADALEADLKKGVV